LVGTGKEMMAKGGTGAGGGMPTNEGTERGNPGLGRDSQEVPWRVLRVGG